MYLNTTLNLLTFLIVLLIPMGNLLNILLPVWEPPTVNIGALKRAVFHQMWKPLTTNTLALKRAVCHQLSPQLQCKL
jgi:hypothetical protein